MTVQIIFEESNFKSVYLISMKTGFFITILSFQNGSVLLSVGK